MKRTWTLVAAVTLFLAACGSGDDDSSSSSSSKSTASGCADHITGMEVYTYAGDDEDCKTVLKTLNDTAQDVDNKIAQKGGESSEACDGGKITTTYDACNVHEEGTCSGVSIVIDCDVHKDATALCDYTFRRQSDALVCDFIKTIK